MRCTIFRFSPIGSIVNAQKSAVTPPVAAANWAGGVTCALLKKASELDPSFAPAHWGLSGAYSFKSLHQPAIAAGRRAVELSHGATLFVAILGEAFAAAGHRDEARDILERLHEASKQRYVSPYDIGRIYATLGEADEALRWLEIAYAERTAHTVCLKTDPRLDNLRPDPRFQDLMRRMNFPE